MKVHSEEIYGKQRNEHNVEKYIQWVTIRVYFHSFIAAVASEICDIPRNSLKIRTYSSLRSSKVIDLGANRKRTCNVLLVINSNYGRISYRFRDIGAFSLKIACFLLFDASWRKNALRYQRNLYTAEKYNLMGCNFVADNVYLLPIFIRLAVVGSQICEIPKEFELIAGLGHPKSSILVSVLSGYKTSYWSLIVTLDVSPAVFEILTFKSRKWLVFPTPTLFDAPARGNPLEFLDET